MKIEKKKMDTNVNIICGEDQDVKKMKLKIFKPGDIEVVFIALKMLTSHLVWFKI